MVDPPDPIDRGGGAVMSPGTETRRIRLTALMIATCGMTACLQDVSNKQYFEYQATDETGDWAVTTPEAAGFDPRKLGDFFNTYVFSDSLFVEIRSLLIIRDGKLVAEAYPFGEGYRQRLSAQQSITKSIVSMLLGIALDRGAIGSLDERVSDWLPEIFEGDPYADPKKLDITLRHLLTMRSGLEYFNGSDTRELALDFTGDSLTFVVHRPLLFHPGTRFHYSDGDAHLLSAVVAKAMGDRIDNIAARELFTPVGIERFHWERYPDDRPYGAYGLWMRPRDMARIGQLALDEGLSSGGEVVVPASWMRESVTVQADNLAAGFGYYWWVRRDFDAYTASGFGGQYIYVIPDSRMVIVLTNNAFSQATSIQFGDLEEIVYKILDALREPPW